MFVQSRVACSTGLGKEHFFSFSKVRKIKMILGVYFSALKKNKHRNKRTTSQTTHGKKWIKFLSLVSKWQIDLDRLR